MTMIHGYAREALDTGRRIIAERGIDLASALPTYKSLHPYVPESGLEQAFAYEMALIDDLRPPYTVDSIARQIADATGAYPWNGPVATGSSLEEYRNGFRGYAADRLLVMQQHGLTDRDQSGTAGGGER